MTRERQIMHRVIGASGVVAGMIIVVLVARHGYVSSSARASGIAVAFIFALFAIGSLAGPAIAVYLWRRRRAWSISVGFLVLAALGANLSITLAAIQDRYDELPVERIAERIVEPIAEPIKVVDPFAADRDALDRIKRELASLRDYEMITAAAVEVANRAAAAATESRQAACSSNSGGQSTQCSRRDSDERLALAAVAKAKENRAATERVNELRVDLAMIQRRLAEDPPPVIQTPRAEGQPAENLQTEVPEHTQLFQIPDVAAVTADTWQKFAIAAFVELLIACAFVAFEVKRPKALQPAAPSPNPMPKLAGRGLSHGRAVSAQMPTWRVHEYVADRLETRRGAMVAFSDVYLDYEAWCQHHRTLALTPYEFSERMTRVFKGTDVFTRDHSNIIQFVNVRLAGPW